MKPRQRAIAAVLALFLGFVGAHKFYLGDRRKGILYAAFFWTFIPAILSLWDLLRLLMMNEHEFNVRYNADVFSAAELEAMRAGAYSADAIAGRAVRRGLMRVLVRSLFR